jgi:hypothetical protein
MDVKLFSTNIPTQKATFEDIVNKVVEADSKKKQVKTASAETEEAEGSGQLEVEPLHQKSERDIPEKEEKENKKETKKEAKKLDSVGEEDADINNDGDVDEQDEYLANRREEIAEEMDDDEQEEEMEELEDEIEEKKEAGKLPRLIRLASIPRLLKEGKLNQETYNMLKDYWTQVYPAEYVDAMLAEE